MKRFLPGILLVFFALAAGARAETPLAEYAARLDRAAEILAELLDEDDEKEDLPSVEEILDALEEVEALVPATDSIRFDDRQLPVDNRKLIEAVRQLAQRCREEIGSEEERYDQLVEITGRIAVLAERVGAAVEAAAAGTEDHRSRLDAILARPEYRTEAPAESRLQRWMRQMWKAFLRFLLRMFETEEGSKRQPGTGTLSVVRVLIAAALAAALVIGAIALARRLRRRRRRGESEEKKREVLGEVLPDETTAAELRLTAAEMARRGEWRAAIRRAYIALLYELDERGKLRLDRAKTNRDYLNELRHDPDHYRRVAARTEIFERVWYGERQATREDYERYMENAE